MTAVAAVMPTWDVISQRLSQWAADERGEWSGLPIPVEGHRLLIEDKNPWKSTLASLEQAILPPLKDADDAEPVEQLNSWYSRSHRGTVVVARVGGKVIGRVVDHDTGIKSRAHFGTLAASSVWSFDAELTAQQKLCGLLKEHLAKMYLMTGAFLETSARSGVTYMFRRCRPTLAMRPVCDSEGIRLLCALCLHPIGYYEGTWAGSMVPTDEVIAHLVMMRGDEPLFWRRANQHPAWSPLAGL